MKTFKLILISILSITASSAWSDNSPTKIRTEVNKVYIPNGFDDNDNVQVVAEGIFPDTCYRPAASEAAVDFKKNEITLMPMAYKYTGTCLMVLLPFDITFQFGPLKSGTYAIKRMDGSLVGSINIRRSLKSEPDDYLYAPVSQAFVNNLPNSSTVFLTGQFSLSCMKMKEVRYQIQDDVIVIQPIAEIDETKTCDAGSFSFSEKVDLGAVKSGKYLLHVRSMNGKAVNTLIRIN